MLEIVVLRGDRDLWGITESTRTERERDGRRCPPRGGVGDGRHRIDRHPRHAAAPQSGSGRCVGALRREGRQGRRRTRQRRADRPGRHQRRGRADRPETRLRDLRGQRPGTRCAGHPGLRQAARSRNQRRHDEHHAIGQSARLRTRGVARPTGRRGQAGPGVAVRVGDRAGLRRRLPAAGAVHAVVVHREDSLVRDRPVRRLRGSRHHERRVGLRPAARLPALDQLIPARSPANGRGRSG